MRDPHVVSLRYDLLVPAGEIYKNVPSITINREHFHGTLEEGVFIATMMRHHPSPAEARAPVDDFLKGWVMDARLSGRKIEFSYVDAEVIDRDPYPDGTQVINCAVAIASFSGMRATITVSPSAYPSPPTWSERSEIVERMFSRFVNYQEGRESIYSAAYYCLTELQFETGQTVTRRARAAAARRFKIEESILDVLGTLSSERGDSASARKAGTSVPSDAEMQWLLIALPRIIRHVAQVEGGAVVEVLNPASLPELQQAYPATGNIVDAAR